MRCGSCGEDASELKAALAAAKERLAELEHVAQVTAKAWEAAGITALEEAYERLDRLDRAAREMFDPYDSQAHTRLKELLGLDL